MHEHANPVSAAQARLLGSHFPRSLPNSCSVAATEDANSQNAQFLPGNDVIECGQECTPSGDENLVHFFPSTLSPVPYAIALPFSGLSNSSTYDDS